MSRFEQRRQRNMQNPAFAEGYWEQDAEILRLSERDAQKLMDALDNPGPTPPKLIEAAERYKALMGEDEDEHKIPTLGDSNEDEILRQRIEHAAEAIDGPSFVAELMRAQNEPHSDLLDEVIAERTADNPDFPSLVDEAYRQREREHGIQQPDTVDDDWVEEAVIQARAEFMAETYSSEYLRQLEEAGRALHPDKQDEGG